MAASKGIVVNISKPHIKIEDLESKTKNLLKIFTTTLGDQLSVQTQKTASEEKSLDPRPI